jgi:DNA-binding GntR family transcriptional regulator
LFDQAERQRILRTKFGPQKILKRDTGREHKQIFDAALSRDAKAAVRALERHYQATAEQVVSVLSRMAKVVAKRA